MTKTHKQIIKNSIRKAIYEVAVDRVQDFLDAGYTENEVLELVKELGVDFGRIYPIKKK